METKEPQHQTKPPLAAQVLQTTPTDPDRLDPTLTSKPDSVCPPGFFLAQFKLRPFFLLPVECASA